MMSGTLLTFIETPIFTEDRKNILSDDDYQQFQQYLLENYEFGDVMPQTGGCQKIRWRQSLNHKGKRGGARVIYYVVTTKGRLYLLTMYPKSAKQNLNAAEKQILKQLVSRLKEE